MNTTPYLLTALLLIASLARAQQKPIALHPDNPHYFLYKDKPTVLVTSAEHYGAVVNLDFDYVPYLKELQSHGLNLTRVFTGAYIEPPGAFNIAKNTLASAPNRFIAPWARSTTPGFARGGNKFDLTRWDEAYFKRLKDFVAEASKRGVVVELAFFCPFYKDIQWEISPFNPANNVNQIDSLDRTDVYTLDKSGKLLAVQEALVRKIIDELRGADNLIYEICNEPYFGGITMEWQHHIASIIAEAEKGYAMPHLISQNIANNTAKIQDPHPAVSVFNFHYASPPYAVPQNYALNKVIGDNETGFDGTADSAYRHEAWAFMLAGGGLFNNLDYSFTAEHENGTFRYPDTQPGGGGVSFRRQMSILKNFMNALDFVDMQPDTTLIQTKLPEKTAMRALAAPGKQYAVYLRGTLPRTIALSAAAGAYQVAWIDPVTGETKEEKTNHPGGVLTLTPPDGIAEVALRLTAVERKR